MSKQDFQAMTALKSMNIVDFYYQYSIWKANLPKENAKDNARI
jgi:hypothetical protein